MAIIDHDGSVAASALAIGGQVCCMSCFILVFSDFGRGGCRKDAATFLLTRHHVGLELVFFPPRS